MNGNINWLVGKKLREVRGMEKNSPSVTFVLEDGKTASLYHAQDCCESVLLEDVAGFPEDLIGHTILQAEECSGDFDSSKLQLPGWHDQAYDWTFYRITTMRGQVVLRWFGTSNGWYSTSVSFSHD
jgi:hypothetical protein